MSKDKLHIIDLIVTFYTFKITVIVVYFVTDFIELYDSVEVIIILIFKKVRINFLVNKNLIQIGIWNPIFVNF